MSRFVPSSDMSAEEVIDCGYQAMAIISLCAYVADDVMLKDSGAARLLGSIGSALAIANELVSVVHDAVEGHEGVRRPSRPTSG